MTYKEIRPYGKVDFQPLSVTKEFDTSTFTVTYTAKIQGPKDSVSPFNGQLEYVTDKNNNTILIARLEMYAWEKQTENQPPIVLSSESSSSTFIISINTATTNSKQTYFPETRCSYGISSTDTGNIIRYDSKTSCESGSRGVYSYFKATYKGSRKGSKSNNEIIGDDVPKDFFNNTSSDDGRTASCFVNPTRMLADGVRLDTLKYELLTIPDTQDQELVAYTVWSFHLL
ncbi:uncharacterized protein LOC134243183 [Saccostrea cucullata]|uniref:uncharacterized protein LOC134243183 n=1 Tax=Saccostrea cuccullata TaxID=36930 RepID=UPI002ED11628